MGNHYELDQQLKQFHDDHSGITGGLIKMGMGHRNEMVMDTELKLSSTELSLEPHDFFTSSVDTPTTRLPSSEMFNIHDYLLSPQFPLLETVSMKRKVEVHDKDFLKMTKSECWRGLRCFG